MEDLPQYPLEAPSSVSPFAAEAKVRVLWEGPWAGNFKIRSRGSGCGNGMGTGTRTICQFRRAKYLFHVPKEYVERPSHAELLSNELRSLRRSVERCDMLIIRAGGSPIRVAVTNRKYEQYEQEIAAAIAGHYDGVLLYQSLVELFDNPLDIVAATERFRKMQAIHLEDH